MKDKWFSAKTVFAILISLLVALILTNLPLPQWANIVRPQWIVLVVIYWLLKLPSRFGLLAAWLVGILLDVVYGSTFGEHALCMIVISYFVLKLQTRIIFFTFIHSNMTILVLLLLYQVLVMLLEVFLGKPINLLANLVSIAVSALIWPYFAMLMRIYQKHFNVT